MVFVLPFDPRKLFRKIDNMSSSRKNTRGYCRFIRSCIVHFQRVKSVCCLCAAVSKGENGIIRSRGQKRTETCMDCNNRIGQDANLLDNCYARNRTCINSAIRLPCERERERERERRQLIEILPTSTDLPTSHFPFHDANYAAPNLTASVLLYHPGAFIL